jgi:hypothetical protein
VTKNSLFLENYFNEMFLGAMTLTFGYNLEAENFQLCFALSRTQSREEKEMGQKDRQRERWIFSD